MSPWEERPTEIANLLNPAFVGVLLRRSVEGFVQEAGTGMPFELLFLVLPFALHPETAGRLPRSPVATPLHMWLQQEENRDVLVAFPGRVSSLVPYVKEAVLFAAERDVLAVTDDGRIVSGGSALRGLTNFKSAGTEVKEAVRLAELVGRWLARAGTTATIFSLVGVRP